MKLFTLPYQLWIKSKNKRLCSEISFNLHQYLYRQHCYSLLELFPIQIKVKAYPVLTSNLKILHSCVPGFIYFGIYAKKCLLKIGCFRRQNQLRKKMNKTIAKNILFFWLNFYLISLSCICLFFLKPVILNADKIVGAAPDHHII